MLATQQVAAVDAHVPLPGRIHLHIGQRVHAQLRRCRVLLQLIHRLAEAPLDARGGDRDDQQHQHHQRRDGEHGGRQAQEPQQDGSRREQRVHQGNGALRRLPDHQAIARLKGIVFEERVGDGGQLVHDAFADGDPGFLPQNRRGGIAHDDAEALDQEQCHQCNAGRDCRRRQLYPTVGSRDGLQHLVEHKQESWEEERLG